MRNILPSRPTRIGILSLAIVFSLAFTLALVEESNAQELDEKSRFFFTTIAPILTKNCVECHDAATNQGKLDLSHKSMALKGGESGKVIIPGQAEESLLYQYVESNEMPPKRPPLSVHQKQAIKTWIDAGATWPLDFIDPALFMHSPKKNEAWVRRLTVTEYIETVKQTFGKDIEETAREVLPPDLRADGFSNTAYNLKVDLEHIEAFAHLSEIIVRDLDVEKFVAPLKFPRKDWKASDLKKWIQPLGLKVLRAPLPQPEVDAYHELIRQAHLQKTSSQEAARYLLMAMLQSPRFIYLIEAPPSAGKAELVGEYELASRLSYMVWGGPPDDKLLSSAKSGQLNSPKQIEVHAKRMLADDRAVSRSLDFFGQWLHLDRLNHLRPNEKKFPNWQPELADDMRQETLMFIEEIIWKQQKPLSELFDAQTTFLSGRLAEHYGLKPKSNKLVQYDLKDIPSRGGLLTHGSILTMGGDEASMVTRGLFVLHDLLRGHVSDPPPCVDTTPIPSQPGQTQRDVALDRIANQACGGCHSRFEPLAFGLEQFDGLGSFHRQDEYKNALREDGEILIPGQAKAIPYETSAQLMQLLAQSSRVQETMTWKLTQFSIGRPLTALDAPIINEIHARHVSGGGTYQSLMTSILLSDLVRKTSPSSQNQE